MNTKQNNLEHLKGKNPFTTPKGYMEGLTVNIMSQLPEKVVEKKAKEVSLMDRVRPWLYLAAVFVGLGLFFRVLVGSVDIADEENVFLVNTEATTDMVPALLNEEEDYMQYLEEQYEECLLEEELSNVE
ncbi:MAG: hypothetical protein Q4A54_04220 [Parabacteroides sp.]|nr:hypothetical protein [Parabacteroides sp.]